MAPDCKDPIQLANPFQDEPVDTKANLSSNLNAGGPNLGSSPQYGPGNVSNEDIPPRHGTIASYSYELDTYSKNAMLVIHNKLYADDETTVNKVISTFEAFRFEVEVYNNKTVDEILGVVDKFFSRDFTEYGCVGVVVIAPSQTDSAEKWLYATRNGKFRYSDEKIRKYLYDGAVPTLNGKPKIFITEANDARKTIYPRATNQHVYELEISHCSYIINKHKPQTRHRKVLRFPLIDLCERLETNADGVNIYDFF